MPKIRTFVATRGKRIRDNFCPVIIKSASAMLTGKSDIPNGIEHNIKKLSSVCNLKAKNIAILLNSIKNNLAIITELTSDAEKRLKLHIIDDELLDNIKNELFDNIRNLKNYALVNPVLRSDIWDDLNTYIKICQSDVLLLEANYTKKRWVNFYEEIRKIHPKLNILLITSYEGYMKYWNRINREFLTGSLSGFGFGFISDNAQDKEIIPAIETLSKQQPFRYPYHPEKQNAIRPEWVNEEIHGLIENLKGNRDLEKIEDLSGIIADRKAERIQKIAGLSPADKKQLDNDLLTTYMELLIIGAGQSGHNNSRIAQILNDDPSHVERFQMLEKTARTSRMALVYEINESVSLYFAARMGGGVEKLSDTERECLELIFEGYSNEEIGVRMKITVETVKTTRRHLKETLREKMAGTEPKTYESSIPIIVHAIRTGLLKLKSNDKNLQDTSMTNVQKMAVDAIQEIDNLSTRIDACEEKRMEMIAALPANEKAGMSASLKDDFIESMIIKGYSNWSIADMLNKHIHDAAIVKNNIETVRLNRTKLIYRIGDANSMAIHEADYVKIEPKELEVVKQRAEGKLDSDIATACEIREKDVKDLLVKLFERHADDLIVNTGIKDNDQDSPYLFFFIHDNCIKGISRKEIRLLELIAAGFTNEEIKKKIVAPEEMHIDTLKAYRIKLREKFTFDTLENTENERTIRMLLKAYQLGLIKLEDYRKKI